MTFEKWWTEYYAKESYNSLTRYSARDAWDAGYTAGQFALNNELGVAGNEAAKESRRKLAVEWIVEFYNGDPSPDEHVQTVDAIIKEAQG